MSKLHRDNAGYVGCSYEETQDPYYSYNKLSLPLSESDKTVIRDEETFTITVANSKFVVDGVSQASLSLAEGGVYTFDQSDSSNTGHPLRFSYTADGTHGGGQEYTLGVTTNGTPGSAGAYTKIVVPFGLHDLYYYCSVHSGYGGFANVAKDPFKFTTGLPILKTTDAFGASAPTGGSAVQLVGDPTSSTDNPFGTGNGYSVDFDGNDALRIQGGSIGTGDWTIEYWIKGADFSGIQRHVSAREMTYGDEHTNLRSYNGSWEFYAGDDPGFQSYSGTTISTNTWVHAAVCRNGTTIEYFAAGSRIATDTIGSSTTTTLTEVDVAHGYGSEYFTGKISNVRVSNTARYSGTSYTIPTATFTSDSNTLLLAAHTSDISAAAGTWSSGAWGGTEDTNEDPYAANLVLAIPMNGANNGTTFTDVSDVIRGSGSAKTITRTNAVTKTDESIFYGSSGYYDANSSRLGVANSSDFDFGFGAYTIEVWVYPTSSGTRNIVSRSYTGGTGNYSGFILSTAGFLETVSQSAWDVNISHTLPLNVWSHCAVVRKDDTWTYFVNGVSVGSATASGSVPTGPGDLYVSYRDGQADFFGYMQDLRIYKGAAKYTTPFPTGSYGMDVVTYTGNGASTPGGSGGTQSINFSFKPDLIWIKDLTQNTHDHNLIDSVRGTGSILLSNDTRLEVTNSTDAVTSIASNGFTLGDNGEGTQSLELNKNNNSYVAWCWKAGGAPTTDNVAGAGNVPTAGSVKIDGADKTTALAGTIPATRLTASTKYGFSIVEYTGNATDNTVGHGLNAAPKFIIIKLREDASGWAVYHDAIGTSTNNYIELQSTGAAAQDNTAFQNTAPTSSVFSIGTKAAVNNSGDSHIAYCWSEVPGFSKFGSYESADPADVTVNLGFKPKFVIIKSADYGSTTTSWMIYDSTRLGDGTMTEALMANKTAIQGVRGDGTSTGSMSQQQIEFTDTGFIVQGGGSEVNEQTGNTYIYAAFAESAPGDAAFESAVVDQLDLKDRSGNDNNASNAGATWQTSVEKFYGGAAAFDSNRVEVVSSDFDFGTLDFTMECWVYFASLSANAGILDTRSDSNTNGFALLGRSGGTIQMADGTSLIGGAVAVNQNSWVHIAGVRQGSSLTLYLNGTPVSAVTNTSDFSNGRIKAGAIGSNSESLNGYIQDIRVYKGIAKYSSSFSPPERSVQGTARRYPSGVYVVS